MNNKFIGLITLGEGLHNNHHGDSTLSNFAVKADEFDLAGWLIDKFFKSK
jgi:fatty-acid desaturase